MLGEVSDQELANYLKPIKRAINEWSFFQKLDCLEKEINRLQQIKEGMDLAEEMRKFDMRENDKTKEQVDFTVFGCRLTSSTKMPSW